MAMMINDRSLHDGGPPPSLPGIAAGEIHLANDRRHILIEGSTRDAEERRQQTLAGVRQQRLRQQQASVSAGEPPHLPSRNAGRRGLIVHRMELRLLKGCRSVRVQQAEAVRLDNKFGGTVESVVSLRSGGSTPPKKRNS